MVAAKHLVNGTDIRVVPGHFIEYFHLMFDAHAIVCAGGVPSESCLGDMVGSQFEANEAVSGLMADTLEMLSARPMVRRFEAELMAA